MDTVPLSQRPQPLLPDEPADGYEWGGKYDPVNVAESLRWSYQHYRQDCSQPRDLDRLLLRAAATLDRCVPSMWRTIAIIEAVLLIAVAIWGR